LFVNPKKMVAMGIGVAILCGVLAQEALCGGICPPAHLATIHDGFRYGLPPYIEKRGLVCAGQTVPIRRKDVSDRIIKEINYLLQDRRSHVLLWLARADALRHVIAPILRQHGLPEEFIYLAAIESSYNSRALSSAGAYGYWQFIKSTALKGPTGCDKYDWRMDITKWKDDRADLVHSTHSAAKYLAWMNTVKKVNLDGRPEKEGFGDWFLSAAAYNAGPSRVAERLNSFGGSSYWDVPLPVETERYVPRWIALSVIGSHRNFFGVQINRSGPLAFETIDKVRLTRDLPFAAMARLLDTTPRVVWSLNTRVFPEKAVFPARSGGRQIEHKINVPRGSRAKFIAQLAKQGYTKK
jgi:membrane-bound lytic murein transglycosylase D